MYNLQKVLFTLLLHDATVANLSYTDSEII